MPKNILIVDDSTRIRRLVRGFLESHAGFVVCGEGADGLQAIERAKELRPDVIIMDLSMPRMNGLDAAVVLRNMLPSVPIILFTLHTDSIACERAGDFGVNAVVAKTDRMEILMQEVRRLTGAAAKSGRP